MNRCHRCNQSPARPCAGTKRHYCNHCRTMHRLEFADEVRAGVDCYLAADPAGPVIGAIVGILAEAVR